MRIKSFRAVRPRPDLVSRIASVPYDTVDTVEARELARGNPLSFLHVIRAEIGFPDGCNAYSEETYSRAADNYRKLLDSGALVKEDHPSLYVYRQKMGEHVQRGIVCCCHIDDYAEQRILRHEEVRPEKLVDRIRLTSTLNANTGPVFLTYRGVPEIDSIVSAVEAGTPLFDFVAEDGISHTVWKVDGGKLEEQLGRIALCYVADGHHRAASAAQVGIERRKAGGPDTGDAESDWFLAVLFPADQLQILSYNRCVRDLNGMSDDEFIAETRRRFDVFENAFPVPEERGVGAMYVAGKWYGLRLAGEGREDCERLDVELLQNKLLGPVLGIADPKTDTRISFVGGIRGSAELEQRVDSGAEAVAFSMFPVSIGQVMAASDAGRTMPPKSTWFEPKLRSGLFIHSLEL